MMTSVVSNPARGPRDRVLPTTTTQTTQPQKQIQATAEQIRLAQMIYDKNDADFEDKVKQLIEVTGKTQDECMVALHDCNEDVNRAINFLLESTSDTTSWETVGKKARGPGKDGGPSEMKDNREKRGDREASRGRGGPNRRGRGTNRSREVNWGEQPCQCTSTCFYCAHGTINPCGALSSPVDLKLQPEPSAVLSQLAQRNALAQAAPLSLPPQVPSPPGHGHHDAGPLPPREGPFLDHQAPMTEPPQRQVKTQRRRVPPPSKIPSSAVEMPGSTDMSGLNVQFGALDFGSEPSVTEAVHQAEPPREQAPSAVPIPPPQSSLFSKPGPASEPLGSLPSMPQSVSNPSFPSPSLGLPSATPSPSLGLPSAAPPSSTPSASRVDSATPRSMPPHMGYTQSKDPPAAPITVSHPDLNHSVLGMRWITLGLFVWVDTTLHAFSSSAPSISAAVSSSNGMMHAPGAPGLTANGSAPLSAAGRTAQPLLTTSGKAPPNLAQGVPPLLANQYIMGPGGLLPAYPQIYGYEDLQMLQSRLPMDYYGVTFPGTTATMPGRDGLANNPYSGEATKFGRGDSSSPVPPTSLSQGPASQPQQPPQAQSQGQGQSQGQQTQNQAFLNPPLPPGYGYTGLPYYAGMPGVPNAFQYGPTVFVPPALAKQPNMGLGNPSSQYHQQHQPSYGQHAYGAGLSFDDLSQGHAGEYSKGGYGGSAQSQAKSAGSGPGKAPGLSGSASSGGVPDMGASIYSKTQSFDKQGFHTGTPPPFSLPSALGGTGPLNPGGAPGYAPTPFLHIMPAHQQPHSQLLHHHLTQDGQNGSVGRGHSALVPEGQSPWFGCFLVV
uniref:UBA domain-containing protein n=1 Tax=Esox lucius TaxID=8010 RepID=A0A3P8X920_ESOLU